MFNHDKIFDNKGYLDSNKDNYSPFKVINSQHITMKGVSQDILAIPFKNGKPQETINMTPNKDYKFNADFVVEIPKFQDAGVFYGGADPFNFSAQDFFVNKGTNMEGSMYGRKRQKEIDQVEPVIPTGRQPYDRDPQDLFINKGGNEFGSPNFNPQDFSNIYDTNNGNTYEKEVGNIIDKEHNHNHKDEGSGETNTSQNYGRNLFQNPALYGDIDLNNSLFKTGQSINFNVDDLGLSGESAKKAKRGNLLRGIGSAGKSVLNIARLVGAGMGHQNRLQETYKEASDDKRRAIMNSYRFENGGLLQFLKNGGTIDQLSPEQALTGEYITGLPEHAENKANAEVEVNEFVKHPNGDVQKVVGKTHEKGGEKVNLESGTIIISDNLTLGGDNAAECRKLYNINVKAKDTYADVVSKYSKKIGLDKLNEEQENLFKKLKKEEDIDDVATSNLNKEFLSEHINRVEKDKIELEKQRQEFVDYIFKKQEASKPKDKETPIYKDGGMIGDKRFNELRKKYNLSEEEALKIYEQFQNGGTTDGNPKGRNSTYLKDVNYDFAALNPNAVLEYQRQAQSSSNPAIFDDFDANARIGNFTRMFPELVNQHFTKDASGNYVANEGDHTIENFQKGYNAYVDDTASYLKGLGANENEISNYVNSIKFLSDNPNTARGIDNKLGQFTSTRSGFKRDVVSPEQLKALNAAGIYTGRQALKNSAQAKTILGDDVYNSVTQNLDKFKSADYTIGVKTSTPKNDGADDGADDGAGKKPAPDPNANIKDIDVGDIKRRLGMTFLPDQSVLPPNGVQPHTRINRYYERLDPVKITNEENLKELNRNQNFANEQLNNLPDSQRRAALANVIANTQESVNKSVTQTNIANAQNFQQTEQFNIGQTNREENARAVDTLDFERRQLTALGKTQADLDNYFDFNRRVRLGNFNTMSRMNMLNDVYENFNVDPFGGVEFDASNMAKFYFNPNN